MPMTWGTEEFENNLRTTKRKYERTRSERNRKSLAILLAMIAAIYLASQIGGMERLAGSTTGNPKVEDRPTQLSMPGFGLGLLFD